MQVSEAGHLLNTYYGKALQHRENLSVLNHQYRVKLGSTTAYSPDNERYCLEQQKLEVSTVGKGDYRESSLHLIYEDDGSSASDFIFDRYEISTVKPDLTGLPQTHSSGEGDQSLIIVLREKVKPVELHLHYTCFEQVDVISRSMEIVNLGTTPVVIDKGFSANIDLSSSGFEAIHLAGKWIAEGQQERHRLHRGVFSIGSQRGVSSSTHNPFMVLAKPGCSENTGECFGFSLIYSGNYKILTEVSAYDQTRIMLGVSDFDFRWTLNEGERFVCPEVVMTFSNAGLNPMSQNFHGLIKQHLVAPQWQNAIRPVQSNNWEATYFDFDESRLLKLANKAKGLGVELFVLDDGWFKDRNDESSGLGNYTEDSKKLPGGLARLSKKIRQKGLHFGLWVEPEMVSVNSDLYRQHPDWAVTAPNRQPSFGRQQLLLDMSNPEVVDYLL